MRVRQRWCEDCGGRTLHQKHAIPWTQGLILTIITLGLFLPAWILFWIRSLMKPYLCGQCGRKN